MVIVDMVHVQSTNVRGYAEAMDTFSSTDASNDATQLFIQRKTVYDVRCYYQTFL